MNEKNVINTNKRSVKHEVSYKCKTRNIKATSILSFTLANYHSANVHTNLVHDFSNSIANNVIC